MSKYQIPNNVYRLNLLLTSDNYNIIPKERLQDKSYCIFKDK